MLHQEMTLDSEYVCMVSKDWQKQFMRNKQVMFIVFALANVFTAI